MRAMFYNQFLYSLSSEIENILISFKLLSVAKKVTTPKIVDTDLFFYHPLPLYKYNLNSGTNLLNQSQQRKSI